MIAINSIFLTQPQKTVKNLSSVLNLDQDLSSSSIMISLVLLIIQEVQKVNYNSQSKQLFFIGRSRLGNYATQ